MVRFAWVVLAVLAAGCGRPGHEIYDDINSREIGSYLPVGREEGHDGSLLVHVAASQPQHAQGIAEHIVRQNLALSPPTIRVVVDPMVGDGERHVYRWDGRSLAVDPSQEGLPPRAHRPEADGAEASPH
jgi:hypothetical protein